jgi:hypothetical protein
MSNEVDRWKNRRRMAWLSMIAGLLFPMLILGTDDPNLGTIAMPFYMFVGAVVGAYIGFATWDDKNDGLKSDNYSGSQRTNYWNDSGVDSERMAAEWEDRPHDVGTQPSNRRSGKERNAGVGTTTEAKRRGT